MGHFFNPVHIYFERAGLDSLMEALQQHEDCQRILLLTRGGDVEQEPVLQPLMQFLQQKEYMLQPCTIANPNLADVMQLRQAIGKFDYRFVIAIGGGSVLDMAKILIATKSQQLTDAEQLRQAVTSQAYSAEDLRIPWIGIPTTAGTGSEVTSWATLWDTDKDLKYSVSHKQLYAHNAVILPELMQHMPLELSVITSLDALCHATEAYWSIYTNPVTRTYAVYAIEQIMHYLPLLKEEPTNYTYRKELAFASVYAGLAFSNTMTTACHSISYPLTLMHGIPHGIAASVTLGLVCKINAPAIEELPRLLAAYRVEHVDEVQDRIVALYDLYEIAYELSHYGVTADNVGAIVQGAFTKSRMANNPVELTEAQIASMLIQLL